MRIAAYLLLCLTLATPALLADFQSDTNIIQPKYTNVTMLTEGPDDPAIVSLVGQILQRSHYVARSLNDEVSSRFLDRFLDALDPQHIFFLKTDLDEFDAYRTELDNLILKGESFPARIIFNRFRKRLDQQYDFVINELKKETFTFDSDERYLRNRKDQPRPKNLEEARQLWHQRLRYEYLQEKLSVGRPQDIAKIVREKLEENPRQDLAPSLKNKLGKDKIAAVEKLVEKSPEDDSPESVAQAVQNMLEKDNAKEIVKMISRRYNRILRTINDYDNDDVLQLYLTSLSHVYDPHSDYMGKAALENFSIGMKLSLFGIGALLRSEDGYCKIVSLTPNGPAEKSKKLSPNDRIIAVAQDDGESVDVVDMKLSKVVDLIRGPKGSKVRLTIIPDDAPDPSVRKEITLVRDEIKLEDQEAKAKIFDLPTPTGDTQRIGLIDLPSFYASFDLGGNNGNAEPKSTTSDVAKLIRKLKQENVNGIILDLRRNGGGSLEEAINLTGLFIEEGPVVQVQDPSGRKFVDRDPDPSMFYKGPLVVLTSRFSASASEILAGALQDYRRAVIVGDTNTHGKGTVQSLIQLDPILRQRGLRPDANPGALKITIRKFYRASGASTQRKGVQPDIILPSVNNHAKVGEASLENALPWDTIEKANYEKINSVTPYLGKLRERSLERVEENDDFAFIRKEARRYIKNIEDKTVSLNEAERLREKKEAKERMEARKKELASRPPPPGTIYDITLKDATTPGLPDPLDLTRPASATTDANPDADTSSEEAEEEEEELPSLDITLEEAKRILVDLIHLSQDSKTLTAATPARTKDAP